MGFNSVCAMMNAMLFAHKRQLVSAHNKQQFVISRCWWPVKKAILSNPIHYFMW